MRERPLYCLPIAVIDTETTGLDPLADRPIEVGIASCELRAGAPVETWSSLVRTDRRIDPGAARVHGIAAAELVDAPSPGGVGVDVVDRLTGRVTVSYNLPFDALMIQHLGVDVGWGICVQALVELAAGHRMRLGDACKRWRVPLEGAHRAGADAAATARLLPLVLAELVQAGKLRRGLLAVDLWGVCVDVGLRAERVRRSAPAPTRSSWHALTDSPWIPGEVSR
jgi:DNA polymerase III epsilon subunit-like protein